jgi:glycosyltransferase involved in cell wall biosynthesis
MNKLAFFEYFYYLKPNFLPLHLSEISGYFYHPEANATKVKDKTACTEYFTESFIKNRMGTTSDVNPAVSAYLPPPLYDTSCFSSTWCNMQFMLTCFGLKWLLYILYIRTIMDPRCIFEWLILPVAWLNFATTNSRLRNYKLNRSHHSKKNHTEKSYQVSVVIPTKNRYPLLNKLIRQLNAQTYPPKEIVIVDQSEVTEHILIESQIPVVHIPFQNGGHSTARNFGISKAKGELILSLDDDSNIGSELISSHLKTFDTFPDTDASVGPYYTPLEKEVEPVETWSFSPHLPSCNAMFTKAFFLKTGGYRTATDNHYLSDPDLYVRAIHAKAKIILNHQACIGHLEYVGGGLKLNNTNKFRYGGLMYHPAEKEIRFYSNLLGGDLMNKWYFYQCQKFLSKKMARHKLGAFRGIVLFFACPIWQIYFLLKVRTTRPLYAG